MLKPLHTMAHIYILFLEESYNYATNHEPCQSIALQLGVVLVTEKDILEDIACTHSYSFAMKAYTKEVENRPTAYPVRLKHFETDCCALEGSSYRDAVGIPAKKRLKPDTLPTGYSVPKLKVNSW